VTPFTLYLMRHGEPELAGRLLGRTDSPATAAGIAACRAQAEHLEVDRIIASDLCRAYACAAAIGTTITDPAWRELDFGAWDGMAASEVDPASIGRFWQDPDAYPPPQGERWSTLVDRVAGAIAAMVPEPTLVVTHGGPMRAALSILCGFDLERTWAFDLPYAAVIAFKVWPTTPRSAQIIGLWP
jgi:alpha-ribazole phosphatase